MSSAQGRRLGVRRLASTMVRKFVDQYGELLIGLAGRCGGLSLYKLTHLRQLIQQTQDYHQRQQLMFPPPLSMLSLTSCRSSM